MTRNYLACDLGAESGRLMAGSIAEGHLALKEIHRFPNVPRRQDGLLTWNWPGLVAHVKDGLRKAAQTGLQFESISTDSWGVDYVLFDSSGEALEPVFHYRDSRTQLGVRNALAKVPWELIFEETGIQFMPINTIFQLASENPNRLEKARFMLGIGDAFNFLFSGAPAIEVSMASTFQLFNPRNNGWSDKLIETLGLPRRLFPRICPSGTRLGNLRPELALESGLSEMEVIATCSHDTGAAVAGVPATGENWAYLSSGTWSLMGVELEKPVINDRARELNFTNEIGFGNSLRFLKNLSGLWLVQECRRCWSEAGNHLEYAELTRRAGQSVPFASFIDPTSAEFLAPENMPRAIVDFCRRTGQKVPANEGEIIRCALESLALLYRQTLQQIESITHRRIDWLHIVGGGSNNDLLNQFTASAIGLPVLAGPSEATAAGNILIQAISLGHLSSLRDAREVVRNSSSIRTFTPDDHTSWQTAAARFEAIRLRAAAQANDTR